MRCLSLMLLVPLLAILGCPSNEKAATTPSKPPAAKDGAAPDKAPSGDGGSLGASLPAGALPITPNNSKIEFVGTKPNGKHLGGFKTFRGGIELADNAVSKITVEIDTDSLYADVGKLTLHLKSPDFFDVKTHPKAGFTSSSIQAQGGNDTTHVVTGNLTLHGVTKAITFPAKIELAADAAALASEFKISSWDFGIKYKGVDDPVTIKVSVQAPRN